MALKLSQLNQNQYAEVTETSKKSGGGFGAFAKGVPVGIAKSVGELGLGIGELGRKVQSGIARATGMESALGGESIFDTQNAEKIRQETLAANAPGEGTGKFIGTVAQYLAPTSKVTKGQQILGAAASQLPKTAGIQLAGKAAARAIPEAVGTGVVSLARSGGDVEQAKDEALLAGGFSVGLGALGGLARSTYWPMLDDSVSKALGVQGKKTGGIALQDTARKVSGLKVLKDRAKDISVTLDDGTKSAFNPDSASYNTTLQAWNEARKKIYGDYTSLAKEAGENATVDLTPIRQGLAETLNEPRLSTYKTAAQSLLNDIDTNFEDLSKVDITRAEKFLQDLNSQTGNAFFKGTSDAASAEINAGTARTIREALDDVITENTSGNYQELRSQYAALKSIEDDLVRRFQQDARQIGGGLAEYTGAFASGDIIGGLLSDNPAQLATGGTLGVFAALKRKLSDPERFLRRSFDLIDEVPSDIGLRIFGGTKPAVEEAVK